MNAADKLAQNTFLTVSARIATALSIPIFLAVCAFVWNLSLSQIELDKRLSVMESKFLTIDSTLKTLDDRSIIILQTVAKLEARATTVVR